MRLMDNMAVKGINYVEAIPPSKATGKLKQVYDQINHDFMIAAPFSLHSSRPDLVAAVWSAERETMFHGVVPRGHKEAIVAAIAIINDCPYCIDAHTLMMQASDEGDAAAILAQQSGDIDDLELGQLVAWAKATLTPTADILLEPPFTLEESPEIIGAALAFHYINRMANIFLDDRMMPKMGFASGVMRKMMAGTFVKSMLRRKIQPGASLQFLPDADLPDDFSWVANHPILARTFGGITAVIDANIQEMVSTDALMTVASYLNTWHGEAKGISRAWLNDVVGDLDEKEAAAVRLMLLAGLASYQVSESDINAFRVHYPDDAQLVAVTAWGAWVAVRRINTWLYAERLEGRMRPDHIAAV